MARQLTPPLLLLGRSKNLGSRRGLRGYFCALSPFWDRAGAALDAGKMGAREMQGIDS